MHCSWAGVPGPGVYLVLGGVPSPGGCTWSRGGVPAQGGVPGSVGCSWSLGGGCTWSQGVYLVLGVCTWSQGCVPGPRGVYLVQWGVPSWGVYLLRGCIWSQPGVPGPGGVPGQVPPCEQND